MESLSEFGLRRLESSSKYLVDNVRLVLKGVCIAHQNILCGQRQVGFIRIQIQREVISDLKREN
jgi:hypothetical protein